MIIGHIPAGYIFSRLAYGRCSNPIGGYRAFLGWGIFGAIAPDLDLLYFYFVDHGSVPHHKYFTHYPVFWIALILLSATLFAWKTKGRTFGCYALIFSISGFLHLILDTIGGSIWWLAPFVDHPFSLTTILPEFRVWLLNFLFHWSFMFELILVVWASWLWLRKRHSPNPAMAENDIDNRLPSQSSDFIDRHAPVFSSSHPS